MNINIYVNDNLVKYPTQKLSWIDKIISFNPCNAVDLLKKAEPEYLCYYFKDSIIVHPFLLDKLKKELQNEQMENIRTPTSETFYWHGSLGL